MTPAGAGQVRAGLRYIARVPELWVTFAMLLIVGTLSYNFTVVFPLFVEKGLGGGDAAYTLLYSSFSVGRAARCALRRAADGRQHRAPWRSGQERSGWPCSCWRPFPTSSPPVPLPCGVGVASIAYTTATTAIAQIRTDEHMIGRVLAIQSVLVAGTTPIGGPILGAVSDAFGGRWPVVIAGVAALVAATFGLLASRRWDTRVRERVSVQTSSATPVATSQSDQTM